MKDCLFCKIVSEEIPSDKVYEDKSTLAFLDIMPNNPGHTLIIPKDHYETFMDTPDKILSDLIIKVRKVAVAVKKATKAEGINIAVNANRAAGQVVPHLHIHVIPRYFSDGYKHWPGKKFPENEAKKLAKKISYICGR